MTTTDFSLDYHFNNSVSYCEDEGKGYFGMEEKARHGESMGLERQGAGEGEEEGNGD